MLTFSYKVCNHGDHGLSNISVGMRLPSHQSLNSRFDEKACSVELQGT